VGYGGGKGEKCRGEKEKRKKGGREETRAVSRINGPPSSRARSPFLSLGAWRSAWAHGRGKKEKGKSRARKERKKTKRRYLAAPIDLACIDPLSLQPKHRAPDGMGRTGEKGEKMKRKGGRGGPNHGPTTLVLH